MTSRIEHNNPGGGGELDLTYHYEMLSDPHRIPPFKEAIEKTCKGKVVLESGTGSGILSLVAARAGAKQVFATELDPKVAEFARKNIAMSGLKNLTLLQKSTTELVSEDLNGLKAEVIIAENLSTWQVTEPEIQVMNYITEHLAHKDAIRIPAVMENRVELCSAKFEFYELVSLRSHFFEFTGIPRAKALSEPVVFSSFDFSKINDVTFEDTVKVTANQSGEVNAIRLTSPLIVHGDITFESSDSLMPPVVFPLEKGIHVTQGQVLELHIQYESCRSWNDFSARILS